MTDIRKKIDRLLRLAGNNPNVHEAQAALEKARALMMEHHLEERDLGGGDDASVQAVDLIIDTRPGEYPPWMGVLAVVLTQAFRCDVYSAVGAKTTLHVIGLPDDAEVVRTTFQWVRRAAINLGVAWSRQAGGSVEHYYAGFSDGLRQAFADQEAQHQEWGLVLVKHPSVNALAKDQGVRYGNHRVRVGPGYARGHQDGYDVGQKRSVSS